MDNNELLKPSISGSGDLAKLYSGRSMLFLSVFGGIFAIVPFSWLNLRYLSQSRNKWILPVIGGASALLIIFAYFFSDFTEKKRFLPLASSSLGLLYFAVFYNKYKAIFRTALIYEEKNSSSFIPGFLCLFFSVVIIYLSTNLARP